MFGKESPPERDKGVLEWHNSMRPPTAEAEAIRKAVASLGEHCRALHVLHVTSEAGLAAARGSHATLEATPHHLLLDIKWCERKLEKEALCKVNPPIRRTDDRAALWGAVGDGTITTLGSDHAPHLLSEKDNAGRSPSGVPGVETMLPLMIVKTFEHKLDLGRLMELSCSNPAIRFNLVGKGSISPGKDADLAVYDPSQVRKVRGEDLHSKCGWTPYEGMKACFPELVYSRGTLIVDGENRSASFGRGRNIAR